MEQPTSQQEHAENTCNRKAVIAHETAHALVAHLIGLGVSSLEINNNSGNVVFETLAKASYKSQAITYAAGFAGELMVMGPEYLRKTKFSGFKTDSIWINRLGFTSSEAKADLVSAALTLLKENQESYQELQNYLSVTCNSDSIRINGSQLPLPIMN